MLDYKKLNEGIDLMIEWKIDESFEKLNNLYLEVKDTSKEDKDKDFDLNFQILLSALWENSMKRWDKESSLDYYLKANELSKEKNFNVLFNLWVIFHNQWKIGEWNKFINKAKKIEPKNEYLIEYLKNTNN